MNKNRGITLIALIITIIVLLILAGVTIAMIMGDNGILNQAVSAKEETEKNSLIEQIQLEIVEEQSTSDLEITKEQMKTILDKYFVDVPNKLPDNINALEFTAKDEYGGYKINGSEIYSGTLIIEPNTTLGELISVENYGDYINYNVNLAIDGDQDGDNSDIDDWRIFYKDENGNVFIIASDYIPMSNEVLNNALNQIGMLDPELTGNTYGIRWIGFTYHPIADEAINFFKFGLNYNNSTSNSNIELVSGLLDTNIWSGFSTGVEGAVAIGGPTLEIYVSSWNEKGYTRLYYDNESSSNGYYIGTSADSPTSTYISIKTDTNGYNDTLYYPHKSKYANECFGYWLASPSMYFSSSYDYVYGIDCTGEITSCSTSGEHYSVRPLVYLPSETQVSKDENGIWQIEN